MNTMDKLKIMLEAPSSTSIVAYRTFLKQMLQEGEKYKWHDLRKNPEDLPKKNGLYWIHGVWGSGKRQEGECEYKVHDGYFNACWNINVIAWREIEPFEEEER